MSEGLLVVIAVLIFVVVTLAKGVRILPQGEEWIVERLGKYHCTLKPGLNLPAMRWARGCSSSGMRLRIL